MSNVYLFICHLPFMVHFIPFYSWPQKNKEFECVLRTKETIEENNKTTLNVSSRNVFQFKINIFPADVILFCLFFLFVNAHMNWVFWFFGNASIFDQGFLNDHYPSAVFVASVVEVDVVDSVGVLVVEFDWIVVVLVVVVGWTVVVLVVVVGWIVVGVVSLSTVN